MKKMKLAEKPKNEGLPYVFFWRAKRGGKTCDPGNTNKEHWGQWRTTSPPLVQVQASLLKICHLRRKRNIWVPYILNKRTSLAENKHISPVADGKYSLAENKENIWSTGGA